MKLPKATNGDKACQQQYRQITNREDETRQKQEEDTFRPHKQEKQ
ncbi:hypothetical protein [Avibacterium avium]|nr:hypothetical protein [Avibacterium avium]